MALKIFVLRMSLQHLKVEDLKALVPLFIYKKLKLRS